MTLPSRILMVGTSGMGMAPLALWLCRAGVEVWGHDDHAQPAVRQMLEEAGTRWLESGGEVPSCDLVVRSSAVAESHPLLQRARAQGTPILRRGEMLAQVARPFRLVAVVGSHGKTTTTAMIVAALQQAGFPCHYIVGGLFADGRTPPAGWSPDASWMVAEVDESDGTIDRFSPFLTVALNFDWDHADRYHSPEALKETFLTLFQRTAGTVLIPRQAGADPSIFPATIEAEVRTFGPGGDFEAVVSESFADRLTLRLGGCFPICSVPVKAGGGYNADNALAALAAVHLMGAPVTDTSLAVFPGVGRRQSCLRNGPSLVVYQDYAHHPSEIEAFLAHMREAWPGWRVNVVFQPHRYSRTERFRQAFASVLAGADRLFLLEVYAASESPTPEGSLEALLRCFPASAQPERPADLDALLRGMARGSSPEGRELLLFVGAGDVGEWATSFVERVDALGPDPFWWERLAQDGDPRSVWRRGERIGPRTTLGVGGKARYYAEPATVADVQRLLREAARAGVGWFLLGRGSNLLVADSGYDGVVLHLGREHWGTCEWLPGERVRVGAGLPLKSLCAQAATAGLSGFEFLEGIPGTVGGSLRMNAGAMGGWIFDVVESVDWVTAGGVFQSLPVDAFHTGYRHCEELRHGIALGAVLQATGREDPGFIRERMSSYASRRRESQPREPSAGCVFKNPEGDHAGRLIDQAGLKGARIGDAAVSTRHANFIVNLGQATCADVLALVRRVREEVERGQGVTLEPEVLLLGHRWEEVLS